MYGICKQLITLGGTPTLKEDMGVLMLAGLLTQEEFTELCAMLGGEK